jgi:hypothetical protein
MKDDQSTIALIDSTIRDRLRRNQLLIDESISSNNLHQAFTLLLPFMRQIFEDINETKKRFNIFGLRIFVSVSHESEYLDIGNARLLIYKPATPNGGQSFLIDDFFDRPIIQLSDIQLSLKEFVRAESYHGILHLQASEQKPKAHFEKLVHVPENVRIEFLIAAYNAFRQTLEFLLEPSITKNWHSPEAGRQPRIANKGVIENIFGFTAFFLIMHI